MDAIIPRYDLPDTWAGKGACPVCRVRGRLAVVHQTVTPDQMWCAACDAAFEVESGGAHMRLVRLPVAVVTTAPEHLLERWVLPSELPALLAEASAPGPAAAALAAEAAPTLVERPLPPEAQPTADAPAPPPDSMPATTLDLTARAKLNDEIRELLYGPDEGVAVAGHAAPAADPATPDEAATLLAGLSGMERTEAAATAVEPAALLSELLADLPDAPAFAPADDEQFLESLTAKTDTAPAAGESPAEGDAASLLAQLLEDLPAAGLAPADEAHFLDSLAAGAAPTQPETPSAPSPGTPSTPGAASQTPDQRGLMSAGDATVAVPEVVIIVPEPLGPTELAARAMQLYKLGNSLALIETALQRTGASADQIAAAMREVRLMDQQRLARHARTYRWLAGAGLVLVLFLIVVGAVSALRPVPPVAAGPSVTSGPSLTPGGPTLTPTPAYNPIIALINLLMPSDVKIVNGDTPTPGPTSEILGALFPPTATPLPETATAMAATATAVQATAAAGGTLPPLAIGVPDWVMVLVPPDVDVAGAPQPIVDQSGPPRADCPFTAELASALFGGSGVNWHFDAAQDLWYMAAFDAPTTVRVPLNMTSEYLVLGDPLQMRKALGPATITNISFITITCE